MTKLPFLKSQRMCLHKLRKSSQLLKNLLFRDRVLPNLWCKRRRWLFLSLLRHSKRLIMILRGGFFRISRLISPSSSLSQVRGLKRISNELYQSVLLRKILSKMMILFRLSPSLQLQFLKQESESRLLVLLFQRKSKHSENEYSPNNWRKWKTLHLRVAALLPCCLIWLPNTWIELPIVAVHLKVWILTESLNRSKNQNYSTLMMNLLLWRPQKWRNCNKTSKMM